METSKLYGNETADQLEDYINGLYQHQINCEKNGKYVEAEST